MVRIQLQFSELDSNDKRLVEETKMLLKEHKSALSSVSAGLRTDRGNEYFGLDVEPENLSTVGICAEFSAIGTMVTNGEKNIDTIVAVCYKGGYKYHVLAPCGKCREFAKIFGNPYFIVRAGRKATDLKKLKLSDLMPLDWNSRL
jgi:cytidine deaminase